ncbi:MAG: DUF4920 domain-containing protein [Bacteroidetes bacterium]|nr:DUF4920 domain-containing protein [Bacteroidota bacterium]
MKRILFSSLLVLSFLFAQAQPPAGDANVGDSYGATFKVEEAVSLQDVAKKLKGGSAVPEQMQITAKVLDVCPKKGCWLKLELSDGETATVKMKDYGFFLPVAAIGKKVVVNGAVTLKTVSVAEQKHYAEDAKKSQAEIDAIKEPKQEIRVLASGIQIVQ